MTDDIERARNTGCCGAAHLLAALEEHISRCKEIIRKADAELAGLKAQLNEHEQRMAANESSSTTART